MSAQPTSAPTSNDGAPAPPDHAQYYREVLHELIEIGRTLARTLPPQPEPGPDTPTKPAETAIAYERVTRAIRRTILLAKRLDDPAPPSPAQRRAAARRQIIREVEDAIQRRPSRPGDNEALTAELNERLDAPELEDEIDHRPVPDIIADICRDLGLAAPPGLKPWKRRTPADIANLCARAAHPAPANAPAFPSQPERFFRLVPSPNEA